MYGYSAGMHVCIAYLYSAQRNQKRASDPLELELQTVVNLHVGAGIEPGSSGRAASALNHWAISSSIHLLFFKAGCHYVALTWNWLCRPGWPQTHRDPPASASWALELSVHHHSWLAFFLRSSFSCSYEAISHYALISIFLRFIFFMCTGILLSYISVYHVCARVPWG